MANDALAPVRSLIGLRLQEISSRAERLSPLDIHARMEAIAGVAAANGMTALEGLAHCSAQLALLPGHRIATRCCLEHMEDALGSEAPADCATILSALAVRLH
jgi:hypothetical protein